MKTDSKVTSQEIILQGIQEIENGIAEIELQSISFDSDPWLSDYLAIIKNRSEIMKSAFEDHFSSNQKAA